jgi:4-oxalocrotonate tautomerase
MPFARLTIADPGLDAGVQQDLAASVTHLLANDLHKEPDVAVVQINLTPVEHWFVGGRRNPATTGAHLEVSITAASNTEAEKAKFLADAFQLLTDKLQTLPAAVYVALYQLDAEAYGYNGVSQMTRHHNNPDERD